MKHSETKIIIKIYHLKIKNKTYNNGFTCENDKVW